MEAGVAREPGFDRWRFVSAVIIHHQMDVEIGGYVGLDGAQELKELT